MVLRYSLLLSVAIRLLNFDCFHVSSLGFLLLPQGILLREQQILHKRLHILLNFCSARTERRSLIFAILPRSLQISILQLLLACIGHGLSEVPQHRDMISARGPCFVGRIVWNHSLGLELWWWLAAFQTHAGELPIMAAGASLLILSKRLLPALLILFYPIHVVSKYPGSVFPLRIETFYLGGLPHWEFPWERVVGQYFLRALKVACRNQVCWLQIHRLGLELELPAGLSCHHIDIGGLTWDYWLHHGATWWSNVTVFLHTNACVFWSK